MTDEHEFCSEHSGQVACVKGLKNDLAELKQEFKEMRQAFRACMGAKITPKLFGILIVVLLAVFGGLFAMNLTSNNKLAALNVKLEKMDTNIENHINWTENGGRHKRGGDVGE